MRIISFIEDLTLPQKIFHQLDLWDIRIHDPPATNPVYIPVGDDWN